ncbi:MAG TPA: metallophosphoesterase [Chthoniobacterales bacterium]
MCSVSQTQVFVAENVLLDARLALFHKEQKWLAIADLHFGFELSQRLAGTMVPWWGMESTSARLLRLLRAYQPQRLIIVGDLVHDRAGAGPARKLLAAAREYCDVIAIAGNHDRELRKTIEFVDAFSTNGFEFHHGDCRRKDSDAIEVIGHLHPASTLRDGAGLHLKFPAFVQKSHCWILPAFSPWASGVESIPDCQTRIWLCTPERIMRLEPAESPV